MSYLDSTANCPLSEACLGCGADQVDLDVATLQSPVGVFCATLCYSCAEVIGQYVHLNLVQAVAASLEHCTHLGITADEMAELIAGEAARDV